MLHCCGFSASFRYLRTFRKRHATFIKLADPLAQKAKRFRAVNAESMTNYFAALEQVVVNQKITEDRIFNLDKISVTPEKDFTKQKTFRQIMPIAEQVVMMIVEWDY